MGNIVLPGDTRKLENSNRKCVRCVTSEAFLKTVSVKMLCHALSRRALKQSIDEAMTTYVLNSFQLLTTNNLDGYLWFGEDECLVTKYGDSLRHLLDSWSGYGCCSCGTFGVERSHCRVLVCTGMSLMNHADLRIALIILAGTWQAYFVDVLES